MHKTGLIAGLGACKESGFIQCFDQIQPDCLVPSLRQTGYLPGEVGEGGSPLHFAQGNFPIEEQIRTGFSLQAFDGYIVCHRLLVMPQGLVNHAPAIIRIGMFRQQFADFTVISQGTVEVAHQLADIGPSRITGLIIRFEHHDQIVIGEGTGEVAIRLSGVGAIGEQPQILGLERDGPVVVGEGTGRVTHVGARDGPVVVEDCPVGPQDDGLVKVRDGAGEVTALTFDPTP